MLATFIVGSVAIASPHEWYSRQWLKPIYLFIGEEGRMRMDNKT